MEKRYTGGQAPEGMYDRTVVRNVCLNFAQANYWALLTNNYATETEIPAEMIVDGVSYPNVGVRFRGNTSYTMIGSSQKKSFAIDTEFTTEDQNVMAEGPLHAAWKISVSGESVTLSDASLHVADQVIFGAQQVDMGYARIPNGTGDFVIQRVLSVPIMKFRSPPPLSPKPMVLRFIRIRLQKQSTFRSLQIGLERPPSCTMPSARKCTKLLCLNRHKSKQADFQKAFT